MRTFLFLLTLATSILILSAGAQASPAYLAQYNAAQGTSASCSLCHTTTPALNATGTKFLQSGHNVASIAPAGGTTGKPAATPAKSPPSPAVPGAPATPAKSPSSPAVTAAPATPVTPAPPAPAAGAVGQTTAKAKKAAKKAALGSTPARTGQTGAVTASVQPAVKRLRMKKGTPAASPALPSLSAAPAGAAQGSPGNMGQWTGKWFKVTMKNKGYFEESSGLSPDRASVTGYLQIGPWDPAARTFQSTLHQVDPASGQGVSGALPMNYISGNEQNFKFWSQGQAGMTIGFTGRVVETGTPGTPESATLRSQGGYHLQTGDGSGSEVAGWLAVSGRMVSESALPPGVAPLP